MLRHKICSMMLLFAGTALAAETLTPNDKTIRQYLAAQANELEHEFMPQIKTKEDFEKIRPALKQAYFEMQGLWPLPEKTPLNAKVTGRLEMPDYSVEMVHFQSKPGLYVTANLYLPKPLNGKYPTILYQCGHKHENRDGNKSGYQDFGIWFAKHGYVALVTDSLQLGEIASFHHGTYRENRWWWQSAGYTPAGVECWNAIRALDYLCTRPEVDGERIGATGISGGGSATMWIAAADERIKICAPTSGMSDLQFYVAEDGVNGHCDCMFLYNRARWNWTQIPALIAPRPLLFVNSDADSIFPMSANNRIINRLEWLYARWGLGDRVSAVVSVGGHAYRRDLRREIFEFFNRYFKNSLTPVDDPDAGYEVAGDDKHVGEKQFIEHKLLRVFKEDSDIPADAINVRVDRSFVPAAHVEVPVPENYTAWRSALLNRLREMTFNAWPSAAPKTEPIAFEADEISGEERTEEGIKVAWHWIPGKKNEAAPWLIVLNEGEGENAERLPPWSIAMIGDAPALLLCPRGVGRLSWTKKNPPNTVERSLALLGATVDGGRIWDIMSVAKNHSDGGRKWRVAGSEQAGILAAYAALFEPSIEAVTVVNPPSSHIPAEGETKYGPPLLNVLRVLDIPEALGCLAPKPLHLKNAPATAFDKTAAIYNAAGAADKLIRDY